MNESVRYLPYSERLRRYEEAKKRLAGLSAAEYQTTVIALADYYGI